MDSPAEQPGLSEAQEATRDKPPRNSPAKAAEGIHQKDNQRKEEDSDRRRDAAAAAKLVESPDLNDVLDELRNELLSITQFLDGSAHYERIRPDDRLILVTDLQQAIDAFNSHVERLRKEGKQFRVTDVWGAANDMQVLPTEVSIGFPRLLKDKLILRYAKASGTVSSNNALQVHVTESGIAIVPQSADRGEVASMTIDTLLFNVQRGHRELLDREPPLALKGTIEQDFWITKAIDRFKSYGLRVYTIPSTRHRGSMPRGEFLKRLSVYSIAVDLNTSSAERTESRYLLISLKKEGDEFTLKKFSVTDRIDASADQE